MELLKNHYEKILLSVVLLGLAVAAGYLPFEVSNVRQKLDAVTQQSETVQVKPIDPLSLTANEAALERLKGKIAFKFATGDHGLFTPNGTWMVDPNTRLPKPPPPKGVAGLVVTNIVPLQLKVEYQGISQSGGAVRYRFYVQNQSSTNATLQRGQLIIVGPGEKRDVVTVKDVRGAKDNPDGFDLELSDPRTAIVLAKDKPFVEVSGYMADLRHEQEGRNYLRQRPGTKINVSGTTYNVVAISSADVTIEDDKTKRRTAIPLKASL